MVYFSDTLPSNPQFLKLNFIINDVLDKSFNSDDYPLIQVLLGRSCWAKPWLFKTKENPSCSNYFQNGKSYKCSILSCTFLLIHFCVICVFQIANSQNRVYLNGNNLMMNISDPLFDEMSNRLKSKEK